jgi:hypothetical protein
MIRAPLFDVAYWDEWVIFQLENIRKTTIESKIPAINTSYAPQYMFGLAKEHWHLIFYRYSRGDAISELAQYFPPMLDAWEQSERLGLDVYTAEQQYTRNNWAVNLDHYIVCFWLVGLALALEIPDDQWQRLLDLVGNEGEDVLLDRVIASRQPNRKIGTKLCHLKPYQRLLDVVNAPLEQQAKFLSAFVENWYEELNRLPKNKKLSEDAAMMERPYWYKYHTIEGAYFGYWCVEAVAVVKAFGLDDSLCLGHPNYPGDLLRPSQITVSDQSRLPKPLKEWLAKQSAKPVPENTHAIFVENIENTKPNAISGWFKKIMGK